MKKIGWIALITALLIVGFWLNTVSKTYLEQRAITQLNFEERHEHKLKLTLESLLNKFYADSAFLVTVHVNTPDFQETQSIELKPQESKQKQTQEFDGNLANLTEKESAQALYNRIQKSKLTLPGLVSDQKVQHNTLPGFPNTTTKTQKKSFTQEVAATDNAPELSITKESTETYFNKEIQRKITSQTKIEKISVHVVLDTTSAKLVPLSKETLIKLIQQSIPSVSRPEQLNVTITHQAFRGVFFTLQNFKLRHHSKLAATSSFFLKHDLKIILGCILWFALLGLVKGAWYLQKKRKRFLAEKKKKDEEAAKQSKLKIEQDRIETKEKRKSLTLIAKTKPQALAHTIIGMLETPKS